jgi:hypothetical protein
MSLTAPALGPGRDDDGGATGPIPWHPAYLTVGLRSLAPDAAQP